jgi:hypothetical protein
LAENWRQEYNQIRPHSSLGNLTPSDFAKAEAYFKKQLGNVLPQGEPAG